MSEPNSHRYFSIETPYQLTIFAQTSPPDADFVRQISLFYQLDEQINLTVASHLHSEQAKLMTLINDKMNLMMAMLMAHHSPTGQCYEGVELGGSRLRFNACGALADPIATHVPLFVRIQLNQPMLTLFAKISVQEARNGSYQADIIEIDHAQLDCLLRACLQIQQRQLQSRQQPNHPMEP